MYVRFAVAVILCAFVWFLALRYNLHMLQLNEYHNDIQMKWLKDNLRRQWLLYAVFVFAVISFFTEALWVRVVLWVLLLLAFLTFRALKRLNKKKALVFTARIKRLIATDAVVSVLAVVLVFVFLGVSKAEAAVYTVTGLQFLLCVLANIINKPVEALVKQYYINDAKRILKKHDGLKIVGVTGSYGKTSVKFYIQTLLQDRFNVLVTPESYNTPMGIVKTIRERLKPGHEIFICEMGANRVGDIKRICNIVHPGHAVITSVGPQHLETFHSIDNVLKTKFELADAVPKGGHIILNGDNEYILSKSKDYENVTCYYSHENAGGYYATDIKADSRGTEFTVVAPDGERETFITKLVGIHNVINIMSAITVAHTFGIPLKELIVPVRRIQAVQHRMQMINSGNETIIDDAFNSNPIGSKAAVETLAMFDGLKVLITPGMVDLGADEADYNYKFGTYAAACCDYILLVGVKRTEIIRKGILSKGFPKDKVLSFNRLEDALAYARSIKTDEHRYILLENDLPDNF